MKTFFSGFIWMLGILLGILGVGAGFLAISFVLNNIPIICIGSVVIGFLIVFGMGKLARFVRGKKSKSYSPLIVSSVTMLLTCAFCAATFFKPLPGAIMTADKPDDTKYWNLSTGSHIAYWYYAGEGVKKSTPIIFLHGGPGAFTRDLERDFFKKFTKEGYDVYLYDQPGAGFSDILNIDEYTIDRYVKDIEAIRKEIGAEKVILIGQSFGASLASSYVTTYPNNVEKLIFTAPGPIGETYEVKNSTEPRNAKDLIKAFEPSFSESLRFNLTLGLDKYINKQVGENLVSQKEMTDYVTRMTSGFIAQSFPPSYVDKLPKIKAGGLNLHANMALTSNMEKVSEDLREKAKKINVPAIILRGQYDYIPWENTREYREVYSNSKLIYIKDAGHILWAANEKDTYNTMSEFLLNKELSLPDYTGTEDPSKIK